MVYGLGKFKEYFADFPNMYVFIGGTACDIILENMGSTFRATKDLDIILIIESLDLIFADTFWRFIADGGYEHRLQHPEGHQYYRFSKPANLEFPKMIELFLRKPAVFAARQDMLLTPIHMGDDVSSLSAILLSDAYYNLLKSGTEILDGFSVLGLPYILLFKMTYKINRLPRYLLIQRISKSIEMMFYDWQSSWHQSKKLRLVRKYYRISFISWIVFNLRISDCMILVLED